MTEIKFTVLIVEDEENIGNFISTILKTNGYKPIIATTGTQAIQCAESYCPDIILLDLGLPDMDGIDVISEIRKWAVTPIIVISARNSESEKVKALDAGADDYITKPFGVMELISRVKALLRRSRNLQEEKMISIGNVFMDTEKRAVYVNDEPCELTYKEFELLKLLMINAGIVLHRDTIMADVWGTDYEGESRTLDMHIKTLRHKLKEAGNRIKTVRNVGYRME